VTQKTDLEEESIIYYLYSLVYIIGKVHERHLKLQAVKDCRRWFGGDWQYLSMRDKQKKE
jgi:hypothetical protein